MSKFIRNTPIGEQRRREILSMVRQNGTVTTNELADHFSISPMTVWRDLKALEDKGLLQRVRGGAASLDDPTTEPIYTRKKSVNSRQKEAIAHYAATQFVSDDQIIILEAGTTAMAMSKWLNYHNLTVITNGLGTLNELSAQLPDLNVMSCGGILRDIGKTFVGPQAEHFLKGVRAHTLFLSATGITVDSGISDPNVLEIQVKRAMISSAERVVLLMDSSKFGVRSLKEVTPINNIDTLITDKQPDDDYIEWLQAANIELHVVS